MGFQPGHNLSPPPPKRLKGDSVVTYCRARRAAQLHVLGLRDEEIAQSLGCSARTVRNYLSMPEIHERVNAMIEECDKRIAALRFVSNVSGLLRDSTLLDELEKSIRGSMGQQQENSGVCVSKPGSEVGP